MSMKPLVDRYNEEQAKRKRMREEAGRRLHDAREFAGAYTSKMFEGDYERFCVFARKFLELVLAASTKHEQENAQVRWAIRMVLKEMDAIPEWVTFNKAGDDFFIQPPACPLPRPPSMASEFGTEAVLIHFMRAWLDVFNENAGVGRGGFFDHVDLVDALAKSIANFKAPIDAVQLKATLGLLYG